MDVGYHTESEARITENRKDKLIFTTTDDRDALLRSFEGSLEPPIGYVSFSLRREYKKLDVCVATF